MVFHSFSFLIFFPIVTIGFFSIPQPHRWLWLLLASCVFYMAFVPAYILVMFLLIAIDYTAAIFIERSVGRKRKFYLLLSVLSTCSVLFLFKYFNFFNFNLDSLAHFLGWNYNASTLSLLLPLGLSFHTFQSLAYVIEVYRGHQKVERHLGYYAVYVLFFPQLVAGPIERPGNLLPQFRQEFHFDPSRVTSGLKLMVWGFFKKLVVADRLAFLVNHIYNDPYSYTGWPLILASYAFAFQIYADFSGYSDIARGAARVLGFKLMVNFDQPYLAKSIQEFWQKWHISLSTWFKDYLYIPMGGSRVPWWPWARNVMIVFIISGIWHGANWTFVFWGALHGFYLVCAKATANLRSNLWRFLGPIKRSAFYVAWKVLVTFHLVVFGYIFFRANSISEAFYIIQHLFVFDKTAYYLAQLKLPGSTELLMGLPKKEMILAFVAILIMEVGTFIYKRFNVNDWLAQRSVWIRWGFYHALVLFIIFWGSFGTKEFIYFQF